MVGVVLSDTQLITGVSAEEFVAWLWTVAGMCTQKATLAQDATQNTRYFGTHALKRFTKSSTVVDACRLPNARLVTLYDALPDAAEPALAQTNPRLFNTTPAFCVYGVSFENGICPALTHKCLNGKHYMFCKGDDDKAKLKYSDACTYLASVYGANDPTPSGDAACDGPLSSFTNGALKYRTGSEAVFIGESTPSEWCRLELCDPPWDNGSIEQHAVKCRVEPPSNTAPKTSQFTDEQCLAGVIDGTSGSLCAGLKCDPRQSLGIDESMYKSQGMRFSCLPWGDTVRNVNKIKRERCFTQSRNPSQQQPFPVNVKGALAVPISSITVPAAMVMFSTVEPSTYTDSTSACACSDMDPKLCECPSGSDAGCQLPNGQQPGMSDGAICRKWCGAGDTHDACIAQINAACGPDDMQNAAECACVNATTTTFPGNAGKTYQETIVDSAVDTGAAQPAALGQPHCWWGPCQQAVDATGGGSYLPVAASTSGGCDHTNSVCAVNIIGMNVLRTEYQENPTKANLEKYANGAAIMQQCQLCPPPPNVPMPVRPAGCPSSKNVCDCPGVDKAACMQQGGGKCEAAAGVWHVTVYNTATQMITVSTSTDPTSAVNVNPGDTHAYRVSTVVPKEQLTVLWGVSSSLSSGMTGEFAFDVQTTDGACIATYKQSAVVVVGDKAAEYAARVKACSPSTCTQLPPLQEPPAPSYTATVTVANFSGTSVTAQWDASGAADATHAVPAGATQTFTSQAIAPATPVLLNGGDGRGGMTVQPVRFSTLPSVQQGNVAVWASMRQANGARACVLAVFPDVQSASAYAQRAQGAVGKLPAPIAPGGGSGGVQYSVKVVNYTAIPTKLSLSGGTALDVKSQYSWTGGVLTSITVNGTSVQTPTQSLSVATATVKSIVGQLPQLAVVVTQGARAVIGVYSTVADAQAYTQLVQAADKLLPPPMPSSLPGPKPDPGPDGPDGPSSGGGGASSQSKLRKTLKWLMWVVFAVLVCASIPLLVIGGVRSKQLRRRAVAVTPAARSAPAPAP